MSGSRSAMNFEERFLRILRSAKKVRHDKDTLILENTKGDTLTFRKLRTSGKHESESAPLNREILNTEWKLVNMAGRNLGNNEYVTIAFSEDGVNGNSGINDYFSSYTINNHNNIRIGVLSSTRMAGPDNLMRLERDFAKLLESVRKIKLADKNTLILTTENGKNLIFQKIR